jgi:hypothetical protein
MWTNYIPLEDRRPEDFHYDLAQIKPSKIIDVTGDKSILLLVEKEGSGTLVEEKDTVFYRHETRFPTGYLVDCLEKRRIAEKFEMSNLNFHDFIRQSMFNLNKGSVAWILVKEKHH